MYINVYIYIYIYIYHVWIYIYIYIYILYCILRSPRLYVHVCVCVCVCVYKRNRRSSEFADGWRLGVDSSFWLYWHYLFCNNTAARVRVCGKNSVLVEKIVYWHYLYWHYISTDTICFAIMQPPEYEYADKDSSKDSSKDMCVCVFVALLTLFVLQ